MEIVRFTQPNQVGTDRIRNLLLMLPYRRGQREEYSPQKNMVEPAYAFLSVTTWLRSLKPWEWIQSVKREALSMAALSSPSP
jgi:hypothetical protein